MTFILAGFILLQQGKGDMGLGSMGGGSQMLFGGSGGQEFFERTTWILGALFIFGSLGLAILKSKEARSTSLAGIKLTQEAPVQKTAPQPTTQEAPQQDSTTKQ